MGISLVAVGAKITAAIINSIIGAVNAAGLTLVVPSSVAGTGVSVTTLGTVNFSAASSVSINGVFDSTKYDNYRILVDVQGVSTASSLNFHLRASGTDETGTNYTQTFFFNPTSTTVGVATLTSSTYGQITANTGLRHSVVMDLMDVAAPRPAVGNVQSMDWGGSAATAPFISAIALGHALSAVYDGVSFTPSTGTISGTIRVYGYNNG
jgi:hypothetical protein